jgi:hypothetical protein
MALGIIFVLIITFMPEGLVPGSVRLAKLGWQAWRKTGATGRAARETAS